MAPPNLFPPHIAAMKPFHADTPLEEVQKTLGIKHVVKLDSNENPSGPSPRVFQIFTNSWEELNRYPDPGGFYLKRALAKRYCLSPQQVALGNGSNELIDFLMKTFVDENCDVVIAERAFIAYRMALQAAGGRGIFVPMRKGTHDLVAMADAITSRTKLVFIANPNNPTGTLVEREEFDGFMERVPPKVIVVVDEAYAEYVESPRYPNALHYLHQGRNIVILRTFSKIYGLAGLRVGYGLAPKALAEGIRKTHQPYNVNALAQAAALVSLDDSQHVEHSRRLNRIGKDYLYRELDRLGILYFPTEGNFLLLDLGRDAASTHRRLYREGVFVRPMKMYDLPNHLRVTIGLPEENERFVQVLEEVLELEEEGVKHGVAQA